MQRILKNFFGTLLLSFAFSFPVVAQDKVLVFAASSMTTALNEIVSEYESATGEDVVVSYGSSSALARQLAYGAPADIYISANEKWMNYVVQEDVIQPDAVSKWIKNNLVLIADKELAASVTLTSDSLINALGASRLAIADPNHVPAGIYAKESLQNLGLWQSVEHKLALSNSVRAALALVERGEAPLGIVYYSDAVASHHSTQVATFPASSHDPIVFPKALIKKNKPEAERFFNYLESDIAKQILRENGFTMYAENGEHK